MPEHRTPAVVRVSLDDGSGCYVAAVPVRSFDAMDVAEAVGEAAGRFAAIFAKDRVMFGEWDPVAWKERHDETVRKMQERHRAEG